MGSLSAKVESRLAAGIKHFQPVLTSAKSRDVNESDTSRIVTDMLSELFGYDKYSEVTSEHSIRGTFCDLAITLDGKVQILIEVKAIGLEIKDSHVKQAVDYAANKGIDWVVVTNGVNWRIYKVTFGKPIDQDLILDVDFLMLNARTSEHVQLLYVLTKEAWPKNVLAEYSERKQALSRFCIAAVVLSEPTLDIIRRELKRACPNVKIQNEEIADVLQREVLKRDVIEGEKADEARRKINKCAARVLRVISSKPASEPQPSVVSPTMVSLESPTAPPQS